MKLTFTKIISLSIEHQSIINLKIIYLKEFKITITKIIIFGNKINIEIQDNVMLNHLPILNVMVHNKNKHNKQRCNEDPEK